MAPDVLERKAVEIDGCVIGTDRPPYLIAEMSANHNGDREKAFALLKAAKDAGAHAVKLQTYTADTMTIDCKSDDFRIEWGLWAGRYLYELYQEASTPWGWHEDLFAKARELGITIFSTPFDETAVDFLEELGAPAYKIASFELTHIPLIRKVASTGKPMIMSTGMASWEEIEEALNAAREAGANDVVLLHCVSSYPTPPEEANLRTIPVLANRFDVHVGLSDHTLGTTVATTAVALGISVIEKHFTLDRNDEGPDSAFSMNPAELEDLARATREAWLALGRVRHGRTASESTMAHYRRSIYAVRDIRKGELLTTDNVRVIRPGYGLAPRNFDDVLGRECGCDISRGTPITWEKLK
jgi:N-acetylneuraminate synthase